MILRFFSLRLMPSGLVARYVAVLVFLGLAATQLIWPGSVLPRAAPFVVLAPPQLQDKHHHAKGTQAGAAQVPRLSYGGVQSPIRDLMVNASIHFGDLINERTEDMWAASSRYRIRRGRHPPPGFEKWVDSAVESSAIIVEEFFDRIYKDLTPFWGLDPRVLREQAKGWGWVVSIRNGTTSIRGDIKSHPDWLKDWADLIDEFAEHMPDLDMPVNPADEPRLLVPFRSIGDLVQEESGQRSLVSLDEVTDQYMSLAALDDQDIPLHEPSWLPLEQNLWDVAVQTCSPNSPASGMLQPIDHTAPAKAPKDWKPDFAHKGFVQNWTASTDLCEQPHVRYMNRAFTEDAKEPVTDELIPLFTGSKLSRNNDIVIPAAMYLSGEEPVSGADTLLDPWSRKSPKVFWRGAENRLVKMLDGNLVSRLESAEEDATVDLPVGDLYPSERRNKRELGSWLSSISDAAFDTSDVVSLAEQTANRFLPDVDTTTHPNTRFRALLLSGSLPFKSTLFTEWHDDRLVPWMHFVPLDATLQDLHATLEFFADDSGAGDAAARFIAERGSEWADKVLRRQDMKLYLWRLLLEWARVVDENRDTLGFTGDVREGPG